MAIRLFYDNVVDYSTTITSAASENADLPVANIAHPHRKRVYRTGTSSASEAIVFDLGSAMSIQAVILLDHTLTEEAADIKLQGNATDTWSDPAVSETLTYSAGTIKKVLSSPQEYRYWRIIFTKSGASEYRDIGRVFLGPVSTIEQSFSYGSLEIDSVDLSETEYSLAGQSYSIIRDSYDEISGEFYFITDSQMQQIESLCAYVGTHTPFFIAIDSQSISMKWMYYGKLSKLGKRKVEHLKGGIYWSVPFKLREEL
jgi:hypothetical protein